MTEDCHLVADDDFNGQIFVVTPTLAEHLEDADEGKVEKRQGHGPVSSPGVSSRKSYSGHPDGMFGTHK